MRSANLGSMVFQNKINLKKEDVGFVLNENLLMLVSAHPDGDEMI
jgi:hypothetical protein